MRVSVRVAPRTPERTFARDFDREIRMKSSENQSPRLDDVPRVPSIRAYLVPRSSTIQRIAREAERLDDAAADDVLLDDPSRRSPVSRRGTTRPRDRPRRRVRPCRCAGNGTSCGRPARRACEAEVLHALLDVLPGGLALAPAWCSRARRRRKDAGGCGRCRTSRQTLPELCGPCPWRMCVEGCRTKASACPSSIVQ